MPPVVNAAMTMLCSHLGKATPAPSPRLIVGGAPAITLATVYTIAGCQFPTTTSGAPPCVSGQFVMGATRVFSMGSPVAIVGGASSCQPNQTPLVNTTPQLQFRVQAT
jgi:uncharacterized Zn-binding protein involved in type VI secretion